MRDILFGLVLAAGLATGAADPAGAAPIGFVFEGRASGTLGGEVFSDAAFAFEARGDTRRVRGNGTVFSLFPRSVTLTLEGRGAFAVDGLLVVGVDQRNRRLQFGRVLPPDSVVDGPVDAFFADYDLTAGFAALTGTGQVDATLPLRTAAGLLSFAGDGATPITVSAATGPEPPLALAGGAVSAEIGAAAVPLPAGAALLLGALAVLGACGLARHCDIVTGRGARIA